jgi:hypothetical protein
MKMKEKEEAKAGVGAAAAAAGVGGGVDGGAASSFDFFLSAARVALASLITSPSRPRVFQSSPTSSTNSSSCTSSVKRSDEEVTARCWIAAALMNGQLTADAIDDALVVDEKEERSGNKEKKGAVCVAAVLAVVDGGELDACVDSFLSTFFASPASIGGRSSYLSLMSCKEQLKEWGDEASSAVDQLVSSDDENGEGGGGEYEALMYLGALAYPIDIEVGED